MNFIKFRILNVEKYITDGIIKILMDVTHEHPIISKLFSKKLDRDFKIF